MRRNELPMEEVIPTTVTKNVFTVALTVVVDFYYPLRWFLLAALILIIADLRFGILAARKRGEKIRISKAGRRSFNKAMDYLCWISIADVLGVTFGHHFAIPILPAIVLLAVFAFEINSIFDNYFEYRGIKLKEKFDISKWFKKQGVPIIETEEDVHKTTEGDVSADTEAGTIEATEAGDRPAAAETTKRRGGKIKPHRKHEDK